MVNNVRKTDESVGLSTKEAIVSLRGVRGRVQSSVSMFMCGGEVAAQRYGYNTWQSREGEKGVSI